MDNFRGDIIVTNARSIAQIRAKPVTTPKTTTAPKLAPPVNVRQYNPKGIPNTIPIIEVTDANVGLNFCKSNVL